jgi:23S rRNA pseudouridine1911/1915/1917 synthase
MTEEYTEEIEENELFEHYRVVADPGQVALRVDKFLLDRIPNTSRNKIQIAAKSGNIRVNGVEVKPNYKVKPHDDVAIVMPYPVREIELIPQDLDLDIVYEDDTVIVVNKRENMVVHPGYGNYSGTMVNGLIHHFSTLPQSKDAIDAGRPGLVHRLDKNTTGIMVVAKTEYALTNLSKQFYDRTTERRYWALVWGEVKEDEGTVTGHIGRSLKNRKVMDVFPEGDHGKHAVTHYKVLERLGYVTLVECKLETGRTHQIRAHMKHIGHPLFNDNEYGGDKVLKGTTFTRYKQFVQNCFALIEGQALHAKSLGFEHPKTKEWKSFDSELPANYTAMLEKWRNYAIHVTD